MHAPGFEPMAEFVHHDAIRFMEQLDASHPIRQASPRYRHDTKMPMAATGFFVVDPLHEFVGRRVRRLTSMGAHALMGVAASGCLVC